MKRYPLCISLLIFILAGCATSLRGVPIDDYHAYLESSEEGLIPGEGYFVRFEFRHAGTGKWIDNADSREIAIKSLTPFAEVRNRTYIQTRPFSFALLQNPRYEFQVDLLTNDFSIPNLGYPVRWSAGNAFLFKGEDGSENWSNHGGHGRNGPNIAVEIAEYDVSGTPLEGEGRFLLVHVPRYGVSALVRGDMTPVEIHSRGGDGGDGAEGPSRSLSAGQTEVYGERGYDGGDGGDGGTITVRYPPGRADLLNLLSLDVSGGEAGSGGQGGRGDRVKSGDPNFFDVLEAVLGENRGATGRDGRPGRQGSLEKLEIPLENMFLDLESEGLERSRLKQAP